MDCHNLTGQEIMNRKGLEMWLGTMTVLFAFFAWLSVRDAVIVLDSSTWLVPMLLFSIYIILICLSSILFREVLLLELILIGSLALSLLFAFAWLQLAAVLIGGYFLFLSSRKIRRDMELNIKISPWKSLQAGKSYLLIAISLVIATQYFIVINSFDGEKKVPHFDVSFITKKVAIPFIAKVNPQFKALQDESLTVDQFILQSQENALQDDNALSVENEQLLEASLPAGMTELQKEALKKRAMNDFAGAQTKLLEKNKNLILISGRTQLSDLVGVPLVGSEKISDLFTGLVSNKIDNYFNPKVEGGQKNSVFSMILAAVLFLTIFPIGSVMSILWFVLVMLVITILLKSKVLKVETETVSKESLA
jgi:hypothetical protein